MSATLSPVLQRPYRTSVPVGLAPRYETSAQPAAKPQGDHVAVAAHDNPVAGCAVSIYNRVSTFFSDSLNGLQLFNAVATTGAFGVLARTAGSFFGPMAAGIGMGIGGIEIARSAFAKNPAERTHRLVSGGLDMAIGAATLAATFSPVPGAGLLAVGGLLAGKLIWQACKSPYPHQ